MAPSRTRTGRNAKTTTSAAAITTNSKDSTPSEFADSKIAVGAALTYIEELQKSLPAHKYQHILDLLNNYYSHGLTEKHVYRHFKHIVAGEPNEEGLVRGFVRFLPEGAVVDDVNDERQERVKNEEVGESEGNEGKREERKEGKEEGGSRIVDVTDEVEGDGLESTTARR